MKPLLFTFLYRSILLIYVSSVILSTSEGCTEEEDSFSETERQRPSTSGMPGPPTPPGPPGPPDGVNDFEESPEYTQMTNFSILAMAFVISVILSSSVYALLYIFYLKRDLPFALKTVSGPSLALKDDDDSPLSVEKVTLACSELSYFVEKPIEGTNILERVKRFFPNYLAPSDQRVQILKGISGVFPPGTLTAIMGPSGAGKTTLLNLIGGRTKSGYFSGQRIVNGVPITDNTHYHEILRRKSGYVLQTDTLFRDLTVEETVIFAAMLRLPSSRYEDTGAALLQQLNRVNQVLSDVGLNTKRIRTTRVGDEFTPGISGGQRRRLSIAIELLDLQPILLLDEPTTGLDATAAAKLVYLLKSLASKRNKTIITTIHCPRPESFNVFDNLLLLESGGKAVYHGPAKDAVKYFYGHGLTNGYSSIAQIESPGDYIIDVVGLDPTVQEQLQEQKELEDEDEIRTNTMMDLEQSSDSSETETSTTSNNDPITPTISQVGNDSMSQVSLDTIVPPSSPSQSSTTTATLRQQQQITTARTPSSSIRSSLLGSSRSLTLAEVYEKSDEYLDVLNQVSSLCQLSSSTSNQLHTEIINQIKKSDRNSIWEEALILFSRRYTRYMSNSKNLFYLVVQVVLTGLVLGMAFAGKEYTVSFWYTPYKSLMFIITIISYAMIFQYLTLVPEIFEERATLRREIENGSCRLSSYILSTFFFETPLCTIQVFVLAAIGYWLVDLNSATNKIVFFILLSIIGVCTWQSMVCLCCFLTNDIGSVYRILFVVLGLGELFGGVVITKENIAPYFLPFFYSSVPALTYRALLKNDLLCCEMIFTCNDVHNIEKKYPEDAGYLDSLNNTYCASHTEETQIFNLGEAFLKFLDLKDEPVAADVIILIISLFFLRLCAILSFKIRSWLELRLKDVTETEPINQITGSANSSHRGSSPNSISSPSSSNDLESLLRDEDL